MGRISQASKNGTKEALGTAAAPMRRDLMLNTAIKRGQIQDGISFIKRSKPL